RDYTADGQKAFFSDGKTQDAVIRNIEIIGQAVKGISDDTCALEPAVPWRQIAGMRDKLIHEYFGVDLVLVWDVVERELPVLRPQLERLSQRLADQASSEDGPAS
ncbi:MAG TPA: HepT-like ribonuclease domain-containing protein, partial [Solirubrobacteraceae bacterium]